MTQTTYSTRIRLPHDIDVIDVAHAAIEKDNLGPEDSLFDLCLCTAMPALRVRERSDGFLEIYTPSPQGLLND